MTEQRDVPTGLQQFQRSFSERLRGIRTVISDDEPPATAIYRALLFNNLCGFINRCFPVARRVLSEEQWHRLCDAFFQETRCASPYFRDIPEQFIAFVQEHEPVGVPPWLTELLHYEWIELVVDSQPEEVLPGSRDLTDESALYVNPTLKNLQYQWPVHTIAPESLPASPALCCLLVYRRSDDRVAFLEANPMAAVLLQVIAQAPCTAAALTRTMHELWPAGEPPIEDSQIKEAIASFIANEVIRVEKLAF